MQLRAWQQRIIDDFPSIIANHRRFILKAPTGAGKTVLARELIERFYAGKKVVVLCHRLIILEQLEAALGKVRRVRKLALADTGPAFEDYDILLSTSMRAKDVLADAIPKADLIIVDEAHRVSPNGRGYKRIIQNFREHGKPSAQFIGLTASPERRTGDQRDQLNLAFDAIIDCANIEDLIAEGILVKPDYRPHFVHDLDLESIDVSSGEFPVTALTDEIIKSSMIDYALRAYLEEREKVKRPISAWFCTDIRIAEITRERIERAGITAEIITAGTPIKQRMRMLSKHERGEIEAMVSVGVLAEGWDNPNCNIIVHLRPTLSKVLWGQTVGRGLRSAPGKDRCIVIDVSSNWSTFGPVEKLEWTLWSHPRSFLQFKNRFNWIGEQQDADGAGDVYLLCKNDISNGTYCSHIYRRGGSGNDTCPVCGTYAAIDIYKEQKLDSTLGENKLHNMFFSSVPDVYDSLNLSVWSSLGTTAWKSASAKERVFLVFCLAFRDASGEPTQSQSEYWDTALATEAEIRGYLTDHEYWITKQHDFSLSDIADGLGSRLNVRTLQANYGISLCGEVLRDESRSACEIKYQKAVKIAERIATLGCSIHDDFSYFSNAERRAARAGAGSD